MPQYQYIRIRRDSAANWATRNPILEDGEPGWDETVHQLKVGNGALHWNDLAFESPTADPAGTAATLVGIEAATRHSEDLAVAATAAAATGAEVTRAVNAESILSTAIATEVSRATGVEAVKADLVGGLIPSSQIPALQFVKVVSASSQAAMLAFTEAQAPLSTLCVRTDGAGTFILTAEPPSVLSNWTALPSPTDAVTSVNGHIGPVVLGYDDVGADPAGAAGAAQGAAEAYADGLVAPLATDALVVHRAGAETLTGTKTFTVAPTVPDEAWSIAKTSGLQAALDTLTAADTALTTNLASLTTTVNGKATDTAVVHNTGAETVGGVKTFTSSPVVPDGSWAIAATSGLQAALNGFASDAAVVHKTGAETIAGVKTFTSAPVVPDGSFTIGKTTGLQAALDTFAVDTGVVHNTGAETVAGVKTFTSAPVVPDGSFVIAKTSGLQSALDTLTTNLGSLATTVSTNDGLVVHLAGTETITGFKNLANNVQLRAIESGGAIRSLAYITSSDLMLFGDASSGVTMRGTSVALAAGGSTRINVTSTNLLIADGANFALGTATGSQVGTGTTQKIGFWAATPVVQPTATTDLITGLSSIGLRAAGTAVPITTTGAVSTGALTAASSSAAANSSILSANGTLSGANVGRQYGLLLTPTVAQTGTSAYTGVVLNVTESSVGSGGNRLLDLQVGGVSQFNVGNTGAVTLADAAGLSLGTTGALALYNTTDRTTNYERLRMFWTGNVASLVTEVGGTGAVRALTIGSNGGGTGVTFSATGTVKAAFAHNTATAAGMVGYSFSGNTTATSGTFASVQVTPTINQTTTAGYTALLVNVTETGTGSGTKLLADFQVGGSSKWNVDNSGSMSVGANAIISGDTRIGSGAVRYNLARLSVGTGADANPGIVIRGNSTTYTVTNKALTSNVATLTVGAHVATVGQTILVTGVDATFNGTYTVTAISGTTVSYAKVNADVASTAATGTLAISTQSANLLSIQDGLGTGLASVNSFGWVTANRLQTSLIVDQANTGAYLNLTSSVAQIQSRLTANVVFQVIGATSQAGDLQQWFSAPGVATSAVTADGSHTIGTTAKLSSARLSVATGADGNAGLVIRGNATAATITNVALTGNVATYTTSAAHGFTSGRRVTVTGVTPSAFNVTGTLAVVNATTFTISITNADIASVASAGTATSATQGNPLLIAQNGLGEFVVQVRGSDGAVQATTFTGITTTGSTGSGAYFTLSSGAGPMAITQQSAANVVLQVTGTTSQAGDLQQWRDTSTALLAVSAAGNLVGNTSAGTKIATSTTQKLGFWNTTPVVQPSGTPAAATDLATALALVNDLRTKLLSIGIIA